MSTDALMRACGTCGLERLVNAAGNCGTCEKRASAAETPAPINAAAAETPEASNDGPREVARMSIVLLSDGNATIEGPLENRDLLLRMLNTAHDLSYEFTRQRAAAAAADAARLAAPPPKKFSKAWWAQKFEDARQRQAIKGDVTIKH